MGQRISYPLQRQHWRGFRGKSTTKWNLGGRLDKIDTSTEADVRASTSIWPVRLQGGKRG